MGFEYEVVTQPDEFAREYWAESSIPSAVTPADPVASGRLLVVVVDAGKGEQPIVDAAVQVSTGGSYFTGSTSTQGTRQFDDLEPGDYEVEVVAGFAESERWIHVQAGAQSTVTFRIDPAQTVESEPEQYIELQGGVEG
jgi:hypothetical protein